MSVFYLRQTCRIILIEKCENETFMTNVRILKFEGHVLNKNYFYKHSWEN